MIDVRAETTVRPKEKSSTARAAGHSAFAAFAICQVLSFLAFYQSLVMTTDAPNRLYWHWSFSTWLVRLVCVTTFGLVLFALGELLHAFRPRWHRWMAPAVALIILLRTFANRFAASGSSVQEVALFGAGFAVLVTVFVLRFIWGHDIWLYRTRSVLLIISPVVPIFWLNSLMHPTYGNPSVTSLERARNVPASTAAAPADNVYVFVFDGWPYRLTARGTEIAPWMPSLADAARSMCVFRQGYSAGPHTVQSLPQFLFQREGYFVVGDHGVGFSGSGYHRCAELPNLFTAARAQGYRTYMVGWSLPYHVLLGDSVDFAYSISYYDYLGVRFHERALTFCWDAAQRFLGPRIARWTVGGRYVMMNMGMIHLTSEVLARTHAVLEDPRSGQYAIFHLTLPHFPYLFNRDGAKPVSEPYDSKSEPLLVDQLGYMDRVIGETLARLKERDKYDSSMIVITADHGWRFDPTARGRDVETMTHVPLFIKFPHQQTQVDVHAPFRTTSLEELIAAWRSGEVGLDTLDDFIRRREMHRPLGGVKIDQDRPGEL